MKNHAMDECGEITLEKTAGVADAIEWVTEFDATPEQVRAAWDRGREQARGAPDLLPLILLELRLMRVLDEAGNKVYARWREEMKRLGHWDDRYE